MRTCTTCSVSLRIEAGDRCHGGVTFGPVPLQTRIHSRQRAPLAVAQAQYWLSLPRLECCRSLGVGGHQLPLWCETTRGSLLPRDAQEVTGHLGRSGTALQGRVCLRFGSDRRGGPAEKPPHGEQHCYHRPSAFLLTSPPPWGQISYRCPRLTIQDSSFVRPVRSLMPASVQPPSS